MSKYVPHPMSLLRHLKDAHWVGFRYLAQVTGLTTAQVEAQLHALVKAGYVYRNARGAWISAMAPYYKLGGPF